MDIVDAQVHLNLTTNADETLAAMNAMGIQAALIDEFWGFDETTGRSRPGIYLLDHDVFRATAPGAEFAALRNPDRFSYLLRIHHRDPELDAVVRAVADAPHARALRIVARRDADVDDLAAGRYQPVFQAAANHGLPIFAITPRRAHLLIPYAEDHPGVPLIVDHVGMPATDAEFGRVLELARFPQIAVKWCHAPDLFGANEYPFTPALEKLLQLLEAFGPQRVMWASDFTAIPSSHRWADELFSLRESDQLTPTDKEWILGKTVRTILHWPPPDTPYTPPEIHH